MDPIICGFFFLIHTAVLHNLRAESVAVEPQVWRMDYKWVFSGAPNPCVVKGSNLQKTASD